MGISFSHLLLVLVVVLIVFGAGKVPKMMGDVAKGIRAFREGMKEGEKETHSETKEKAAFPSLLPPAKETSHQHKERL